MEVDPKRIDPLSYSGAQVAICLKDALSAVLFELRKHAVRCSNQSLLGSSQSQERCAFIAQGVRQNAVFDLIQLAAICCAASPIESAAAISMLSNSAALSSMVAPFSAWSLTAIAERAAWWRAVRRNCGHKAKRRSVASIPASSSWRTSWSVPHRASPPQCRLGWRSLDKKTSRVSRGRASCAPIHSRVRTFPKIKSTQTSRRPCIRSIEELPPSRRPRPLSSNSNAQATPGPRSAK